MKTIIGLLKNFSVAPIGYVYTWNYQYALVENNEHMIWQQVADQPNNIGMMIQLNYQINLASE